MTQMDPQEKAKERQRLAQLVRDWNQEHYDIFELSPPNENLEFHGVVRFYFQDGANVVTKCIRVASSATTQEVVDVLVEKFRPDMRMLTANKYALYEVHANGDERRLQDEEKVLYVQLNWGSDVREGRFLLKKEGVPTISPHADKENQNFKRKLSKREKKEKKKQEKEQKKNEAAGVAEKLYTEMPETRFTRSISNPEAVMKRRRQQKVEKKLQQCRGQDGQGGTLKIYGETIRPDVPYKTLLLSTADTVNYVIKETMEKYGLEKEDPDDYCLYKVLVPPGEREYHGGVIGEERIMEEYECPLAIAMEYPPSKAPWIIPVVVTCAIILAGVIILVFIMVIQFKKRVLRTGVANDEESGAYGDDDSDGQCMTHAQKNNFQDHCDGNFVSPCKDVPKARPPLCTTSPDNLHLGSNSSKTS